MLILTTAIATQLRTDDNIDYCNSYTTTDDNIDYCNSYTSVIYSKTEQVDAEILIWLVVVGNKIAVVKFVCSHKIKAH